MTHTHVCRCGERYDCVDTRSLSGGGPCEGSMADGDGCCPRHEAEWDAVMADASAPLELRQLIMDFADDEECYLDHDNNCQAHNWFTDERPCPNARARALIAAWETGQTP